MTARLAFCSLSSAVTDWDEHASQILQEMVRVTHSLSKQPLSMVRIKLCPSLVFSSVVQTGGQSHAQILSL